MSSSQESPQLPPTTAITSKTPLKATTEKWFEYSVRVQPHHTDYSGVVWHGSYLTWIETARVECLRSMGMDFAELIKLGCDLPVVELSLRYHRILQLGEIAIVKTRMAGMKGVRMYWDCRIESGDRQQVHVTGKVTLVATDREKGKIMRQLPPTVKDILVKLL
ncbi:putative 4-hydroxybenzoyl-CoA thioesterase [Crocosphaera subtropica ATCC 51142]|uniref:4-hydroxybenzoyl-CoA thioesterase n=1 Tax=Crocosphaera subtropica (strain ATCC 51142 / BH68) TaxID=43989 RepID=B1WQ19_CROS5|nr:thioesterase family protein [Crocosphaera subtropica]ACB53334.1 putative 4-hydroxybenzoyl-CoA thioesterase [Crocosphaera subtropica ATCC 51142]